MLATQHDGIKYSGLYSRLGVFVARGYPRVLKMIRRRGVVNNQPRGNMHDSGFRESEIGKETDKRREKALIR